MTTHGHSAFARYNARTYVLVIGLYIKIKEIRKRETKKENPYYIAHLRGPSEVRLSEESVFLIYIFA